jgi:hypothetical protein
MKNAALGRVCLVLAAYLALAVLAKLPVWLSPSGHSPAPPKSKCIREDEDVLRGVTDAGRYVPRGYRRRRVFAAYAASLSGGRSRNR